MRLPNVQMRIPVLKRATMVGTSSIGPDLGPDDMLTEAGLTEDGHVGLDPSSIGPEQVIVKSYRLIIIVK